MRWRRHAFGDTAFEWPREGTLALKVDRAAIGGVAGAERRHQYAVRSSRAARSSGLVVGDFGGAALSVKGHIDTRSQAPRGAVTFDLDARSLDGVATLVEKAAPQAAAEFRRRAARFVPAKLRASLTVSADAPRTATAANTPVPTAFKVDGSAGAFKVNLQGSADAGPDALTIASLSHARCGQAQSQRASRSRRWQRARRASDPRSAGRGRPRPGRLSCEREWAAAGDMTVSGQLTAGGLDLPANGTVRLVGSQGPTAALALKVAGANLRSPRPLAAGQPAATLPMALAAKLSLAEGVIGLTDIAGRVAGTDVAAGSRSASRSR